MSKLDLTKLHRGDIIKSGRTLRVLSVGKEFVYFQDVAEQIGTFRLRTDGSDAGSWRYEMVKRAVRPKPYPVKVKAGDVLTGAQVKARPWKRGTIIRCVVAGDGLPAGALSALVLTADATWLYLDQPGYSCDFKGLNTKAKFVVLHVA